MALEEPVNRWGPDGPPPEACSRVTNPERFRPLHDFALTLLAQLHASFDVDRIGGHGRDRELEASAVERPSVRLVAGRFREGIAMPPEGEVWQEWERWWPPRRFSGRLLIDRERARAMLAGIEGSAIEWAPWPRRKAAS